jgi:hypothetical protein
MKVIILETNGEVYLFFVKKEGRDSSLATLTQSDGRLSS